MRHFTRDEWYFDGYTWCGIDNNGEAWYPMSYGDNGCAWRMVKSLQNCLNHGTIQRVKKQIKAELKYNWAFKFRYQKIYLVHIKEYPTFYFDYREVARQRKIKIDCRMSSEEIVDKLTKYGFEPISNNLKFIEVSREEIDIDKI